MAAVSKTVAHAPVRRQSLFGSGFARFKSLLFLIIEGAADGFQMARAAHKRHPFADW
jgi:hypothetical protein